MLYNMIINRVLIQYIEVYLHIFRIGFPCPADRKKQTLREKNKRNRIPLAECNSQGYKNSVVQIVSRSVKMEDK